MVTIYLGADHAGLKLKNKITSYLLKNNEAIDLGAYRLDKNDDYPDFAAKVAISVSSNKGSFGILICGSSQGMCIAANKVKGIRAVTPSSIKEAKLTREHNDANILCLSGWNVSEKDAIKIVDVFIKTKFSKVSRHKRRIAKIMRL